jgi:ribosomal protein S18 acetylase RimI-like enzyme
MATIRRLGPGDEAVLAGLARDDPDFDIPDRWPPADALQPLADEEAAAYLADPTVLFWVAETDARVVGFLTCIVMRYRAQPGRELMLYEIGVRRDARRRGIGRSLVDVMTEWMKANGVAEVWLGADNPGAEQFYLACGFAYDNPATYMILTVD